MLLRLCSVLLRVIRIAESCVELLNAVDVTQARQLASLTVDKLGLPEGTSGGKVAYLTEACQAAMELKRGLSREDGELPPPSGVLYVCAYVLWLQSSVVSGLDRLAGVLERQMEVQQTPVVDNSAGSWVFFYVCLCSCLRQVLSFAKPSKRLSESHGTGNPWMSA